MACCNFVDDDNDMRQLIAINRTDRLHSVLKYGWNGLRGNPDGILIAKALLKRDDAQQEWIDLARKFLVAEGVTET
jgi:hypothetical protein